MTVRETGQRLPKDRRHALPLCEVETRQEAIDLIVMTCVRGYDGRDIMTRGIGGWTPGDVNTVTPLRDALLALNGEMKERRAARATAVDAHATS